MTTAIDTKKFQISRNELYEMGVHALIEHDLWDAGWNFEIGSATRRFGVCVYKTKTIRVSLVLANLLGEEATMDTILHEIAHAIAGHHAGHGTAWKNVCLEIGAIPNAKYKVPDDVNYNSIKKWEYRCPSCNQTGTKSRRGKLMCGSCHKNLGIVSKLEFRLNGNADSEWKIFR